MILRAGYVGAVTCTLMVLAAPDSSIGASINSETVCGVLAHALEAAHSERPDARELNQIVSKLEGQYTSGFDEHSCLKNKIELTPFANGTVMVYTVDDDWVMCGFGISRSGAVEVPFCKWSGDYL
jgi:hypothetical protein